ncbi:MAG: DUF72 domain-containing protein [Thaumarchaeota archaeon]|nr:DUF72 domain-containing protein [Nitrososphaerota archaeon]
MPELYVGTSGWSYDEWVGVFYPTSSTTKLTFYSKIFKTVEVDSTFYAYPSKGLVFGWARHTPPDFVFSVKLPRLITHDKRLELEMGVEADLIRFLGLLRPLITGGKLGPVLIQLPPSFVEENDFERVKKFLEILPNDVRFAIEFRHPSWLKESVWDALRRSNVANTIVDEPLLPPDTVVTSDIAFVRWHGRGNRPWYNYRYKDKELSSWVPKVKEVMTKAKKVYGYFNNHFHGFAVENSIKLLQMVGEASPQQVEIGERAARFIDTKGMRGRGTRERSMYEFIEE